MNFKKTATLTDIEKATLYYISDYIAKKDNILVEDDSCPKEDIPESEFLRLVSPPDDFNISMYLYIYYKNVDKIYKLTGFDFDGKQATILRRFASSFTNGFCKQQTISSEKSKQSSSLYFYRYYLSFINSMPNSLFSSLFRTINIHFDPIWLFLRVKIRFTEDGILNLK